VTGSTQGVGLDRPPTELPRALEQVAALLGSPSLLLSEPAGYWPVLERLLTAGRVASMRAPGAHASSILLISLRETQPLEAKIGG
jgi:hypothetical protein